MSLPALRPACCPTCGQPQPLRPAAERLAEPFEPRPRKGGRQIPLGPAVRAVAAFLEQHCNYEQRAAQRAAARVCLKALPVKQQRPRAR